MLGKLLKHEFKVTSRYFVPMFLLIAATTVLLKLSLLFSENSIFMSIEASTFINIVQGLLIAVYVIVLVGTSILALFLLVKRFYTNMFGDEGYLTHTLPVTGGQLLNSKLICSFVWILTLIPVWILSFLIIFTGTDLFSEISFYGTMLIDEAYILNVSGFSIGLIVAEFVILLLTGIICALLTYYLCITLGQHFLGEHRLAGAILFYFVLNIISSAISSVFSTTIEMAISEVNMMVVTLPNIFQMVVFIFGAGILLNIVQMAVYYLITRHLLTKKLNLY